jgi:hypothetical protein
MQAQMQEADHTPLAQHQAPVLKPQDKWFDCRVLPEQQDTPLSTELKVFRQWQS